ncbi:SDR family NAD(P)-dependent oxidoreductase [Aliiglaciecola sp. LCG003]|uniref:SDR family NAD(P)-dependent oxidoreductase n=1 Tax=Aliiglaciecola sp. LCG003 TaxID=3053655 RepID=UPI00257365A6|nr:SDR family NAD(P)-dependent oxidoreductase [Aliiglaciecola sp. LCG003]WJG10283.1 SDR family NAD(P)-dependent oxidoreductase [Aliiglaciecola sp. LCG003]
MAQSKLSNSLPVAVITGAASGLGLDLAQQLHSSYQLVLIDIDMERLLAKTQNLVGVLHYSCDLADSTAIEQLTLTLNGQLLRVDLLINNAGITHRSLAMKTDHEVIRKVMAVDYLAPVQLTQGLLSLLTQAKGKVINIGSMAGWMPVLGRAGYCAAKSALHQYFETLRAELQDEGVTVLMVYPSFLDTPIEQNALNGLGHKATHKRSMVGKMRTSDWMASAIVTAIQQGRGRLFPDVFTNLSSILYRLFPSLYMRLMRRKLASELEVQQ